MQNHTSPSHPLAAPTSHTVSPTLEWDLQRKIPLHQGFTASTEILIHIAQAYLSMLQQACHDLMQNGIEALKHALGLLSLSDLQRTKYRSMPCH